MSIQNKIRKGDVAKGSGERGGGIPLPSGRVPSTPKVGPKHECDIVNGERSSGERPKGGGGSTGSNKSGGY